MKEFKKLLVRQTDQSDCGVACLSMLLKYYGNEDITLEHLRNISGTTGKGTTLLGLLQASIKLGMESKGFEADLENLKSLSQPVILHVIKEKYLQHYIVLLAYQKGKFVIADPAKGIESYTATELKSIWKSKTLLQSIPGESFVTSNSNKYKRKQWIFDLIKQDRSLLSIVCALGLIITSLGLSTALYSQKLIDVILPEKDTFKLVLGVGLLTILLLFKALIQYVRNSMLIRQSRDFNVRIINRFFEVLLYLPKVFFDHRKTGDLVARMNDTARIQRTVSLIAGSVLIDVLLVVVSAVFVFVYDVWLGTVVLSGVVIFSLLAIRYGAKILTGQREVMVAHAANESNYVDVIQGMDVIKSSAREFTFAKITSAVYQNFQHKSFDLGKVGVRYNLFNEWIGTLFSIVMIAYLSIQVVNGGLLVGEMVALLTVSSGIFPSVVNIFMANVKLKEAEVAFDRMYEFADLTSERIDTKSENEFLVTSFQSLTLQHLTFSFPGTQHLLKDISLEVKKGEVVAIVGESGGGKSTIFQLIQRFYGLTEGRIFVNDQDISNIPLDVWRRSLGVAPQEMKLFNGTLINNIVVGEVGEGMEDPIEFCKRLGFDLFFESYPNGYTTLVGEAGINLSGGQRQLVSLARTLYGNPQILLLDEAFSAMGREMKAFALQLIREVSKKMGVLLATHELMTALKADRIYLMEEGSVKMVGTPQELLARENSMSSEYTQLVNFS